MHRQRTIVFLVVLAMSIPPESTASCLCTSAIHVPEELMDWIAGSHGGEHVEVEGSFDNWGVRHAMQKSGKDFTIIKLLPPGVYQVCHHTCATDPETKLCGQ